MDTPISIEIPTSIRRVSLRTSTFKASEPHAHDLEALVFANPKSTWSEEDTKKAIKVLKEVPFFSSMHKPDEEMNKLLTETLDVMECKDFKPGEIVFHKKDQVSEFYIIIEGSVDVFAPKIEEEMNEEIKYTETENKGKSHDFHEITQRSKIVRKSLLILPNGMSTIVPEEKSQQKSSNSMRNLRSSSGMKFKTINSLLVLQDCFQMHQGQLLFRLKNRRTLGPGAHFGELALANNCTGSISVVAASDLKVVSLSKEAFNKICDESDRTFHEKIAFFAKMIDKTSKDSITRFCYGFRERQYSYGQKIFVGGQIPSEIFIVKHGEVQIIHHESQEKASSKTRKSSFDKIANVGPYNFIGTGEVSETQPYKMTATSCSHDLVLYVIPIKEFQSLKSSYQDVFETFADKFSTQLCYFEDRAENVSSISKKVLNLPPISRPVERKSLTTLPLLSLHGFHTTKFNEHKESTPSSQQKIGCSNRRLSILLRHDELSPTPLSIAEFHVNSPLSSNSNYKSPSSTKGETTKHTVSKEKQNFEDYFNYLYPPQEHKNHKGSSKSICNLPKGVHGRKDFHDREFKIGTTIKVLAEHAKMKRSSWDLSPKSPFFKDHSPMTIFKNCGH